MVTANSTSCKTESTAQHSFSALVLSGDADAVNIAAANYGH